MAWEIPQPQRSDETPPCSWVQDLLFCCLPVTGLLHCPEVSMQEKVPNISDLLT